MAAAGSEPSDRARVADRYPATQGVGDRSPLMFPWPRYVRENTPG